MMESNRKMENSYVNLLEVIELNMVIPIKDAPVGGNRNLANNSETNGHENLAMVNDTIDSCKIRTSNESADENNALASRQVQTDSSLEESNKNTEHQSRKDLKNYKASDNKHRRQESMGGLNTPENSWKIDAKCHKNHKNTMTELQGKLFLNDCPKESSETKGEDHLTSFNKYHHLATPISVEFMDPDTICGIGWFRPQWLQKYATARCYLILYSLVGVIQGSYSSYLLGTLSTLEKRYAFKSKVSGTIMMVDELTPLLLGVLIGYFGGRMHRPRVLAAGMYMSVFCCFISALPYFLYGPSHQLVDSSMKNETGTEFCDLSMKHENCDEDDRPHTLVAVVCWCIGSVCKGFGSLTFYAVGLSYMDDNSKKKNSPMYIATVESMRLFGPVLGFLLASVFLKFYENPFGDPGYGSNDPRWIGAWWLGFVLLGTMLAVVSSPLLLFPRRLPKEKVRTASNTNNFEMESNMERFKGMIKALKRLLTNPLYDVMILGTSLSIISSFGLFILLPKYMEIQFRMSASQASLLSGPPALIAAQFVGFFGGWIIWKWKPSIRQLCAGEALIEFLWAIGVLCLLFPSCEQSPMPGVRFIESGLDVQNECNFHCLCTTSSFSPVCGLDGKSNYFSPCHAGCEGREESNNLVFENCSCLFDHGGKLLPKESTVKRGLCETGDCWEQAIAYIIICTVACSLTNALVVPHVMILLRSVDPQDKSIAVGAFEAITCALGFIPNPVIFGALADSACLIWESSCGENGNCWYYDINKFKYLMHGASAAFGLAAAICFSTLYSLSSRVRDLYEDDEVQEEKPPSKDDPISSVER